MSRNRSTLSLVELAVIGTLVPMTIVAFVATIAISSILNGLALSIMWSWFIADPFGLPTITIPNAIGISLIVGSMTWKKPDQENKSKQDEERPTAENKSTQDEERPPVWFSLLKFTGSMMRPPLMTVAFGWIVHQFM